MNDGSLLYVTYNGLLDLGEGGYDNLRRGRLPSTARICAAPRVVTSSPGFAWVNGSQLFNIGEVNFDTGVVEYDAYVAK